tara:strand:+ start:401 stop:1537 length:1137 start_codon:yes stop_codon:yes gene_type:complete
MVGVNFIWYPAGVSYLPDIAEHIENDMIRYVLASKWKGKAAMAGGRPMGDIGSLDYFIRDMPEDAEDANVSENIEEAKTFFKEVLEKVKKTSLKEALNRMDITHTDIMSLGKFMDINLGDTSKKQLFIGKDVKLSGDEIISVHFDEGDSATKKDIKEWGSDFRKKVAENQYEMPEKEFIKAERSVTATSIPDKFIIEFTLLHEENKIDNKNMLEEMGFSNFDFSDENIKSNIEGTHELDIKFLDDLQVGFKEGIANSRKLAKSIEDIFYAEKDGLLYNVFKRDTKIKSAVLNPRYVTIVQISGEIELLPAISENKPLEIKYKGDINTIHSTQLTDYQQVENKPKSSYQQTFRTADNRAKLINYVQSRLTRLEKAIDSL